MKRLLATFIFLATLTLTVSAQKAIINVACKADMTIKHWNNTNAPHSNEESKDEWRDKSGNFKNTSQTVFYLYRAEANKATGQSVVILPGGGYGAVCIEREGFALAEYFNSIGVTALVVKYRLPNDGHKEVPLEDAQAGLEYLRKNAKKLGIDPAMVGIVGSSAGGHLAAYTSTFTEDAKKPAFSILFYPVISGENCMTHYNTYLRLLGNNHPPHERKYYSLENRVTATTPPTLLLLSNDDSVVPPINSLLYYDALKNYGIEASIHIYPEGGHGWAGDKTFRYTDEYKEAIKDWLKVRLESHNAKNRE